MSSSSLNFASELMPHGLSCSSRRSGEEAKPRVAMRAPATRSGVLATARVLLSAGRNTRDWRVIDRRDMVFLWQVGGIFPDFQQPHSALSSVLSAYFL